MGAVSYMQNKISNYFFYIAFMVVHMRASQMGFIGSTVIPDERWLSGWWVVIGPVIGGYHIAMRLAQL